jgi:imidazolonepropionase-like amidohydrolase
VQDGKIKKIGNGLKAPDNTFKDVDAQGMIAIPGLFECHAHNAVDEYAPITKTVDWMANLGRSGITTMITEGEHSRLPEILR